MYICDVCGREMFRKTKSHGMTLCIKHYNQLKKYGRFLDNNPRTIYDRNDYVIKDNIAVINLYNKYCNKIAEVVIDAEDIHKVKYFKWKLSNSGYAMNTPKYKASNIHMSHVILGVGNEVFIDHIDHNKLNNRKSNLRIVTKSQNQMNVNYKGVTKQNNGKYYAYIKIHQKMIILGVYIHLEEALWARWYAETVLFGEYRFPKDEPSIIEQRKLDIKEYVDKKVQRL